LIHLKRFACYFDLSVSKKIHCLSGGEPREINTIADKLLMSAFSTGDRKITKKHISMLPKDILVVKDKGVGSLYYFFVTVFIVVLVAVLYFLLTLRPLDFSLNLERSHDELLSNEKVRPSEDKGSLLSRELIALHLNTIEWLMQMPEQMYIIQLASPQISINALDEAMNFYSEQNMPMDSIHWLIDLGRSGSADRLRVFYLASASYSTLERVISELPSERVYHLIL